MGGSFSFETVMSHRGKLAEVIEAKEMGFKTYLYFVCTDDPTVNIERVKNRIDKGGHAVPSDKIIKRYKASLDNLAMAIGVFDKCYLFDNSTNVQKLICLIENGESLTLELDSEEFPNWFNEYVLPLFTDEN